ncbi:hypothetical protein HYPSUDRAFT_816773 [Hypholoma sublateritium FD-334 SS-4]|uniref:Uncharacterized protein n=1 Tax=Hypholoma sublateritium (strain FD-334 SS-4) TaxID=945553 RepID=A0A0D2NUW2_HYPSF|nr:hypothetical protein HYPSUDRAFT_816773 [Hypholoma sublateritium FD-334 SS-4]
MHKVDSYDITYCVQHAVSPWTPTETFEPSLPRGLPGPQLPHDPTTHLPFLRMSVFIPTPPARRIHLVLVEQHVPFRKAVPVYHTPRLPSARVMCCLSTSPAPATSTDGLLRADRK